MDNSLIMANSISLYTPEKLKRRAPHPIDSPSPAVCQPPLKIARLEQVLSEPTHADKVKSEENDIVLLVKDSKKVKTSWCLLKSIPYFDAFDSFSHGSTTSTTNPTEPPSHATEPINMMEFDELTVNRMLQFIQYHHCEIPVHSLRDTLYIADYLRIETLIKQCIVTIHNHILHSKMSLPDAHDLISERLQGIDRTLLYNLCDVAVEKGYLPLIKEGLTLGMNPNFVYEDLRRNKTGYNLLFKAAANGHYDITKLLIAAGGNVNYQIITPRSPPLLDERDTPWIENFQAIRQRYVVRSDVYSHCQPCKGCTALHIAVWNNHLHIIRLLINNGARIQPDHDGETPAHFAAALGHIDILKYYVSQVYQGLFNIHSNIMGTPLFRAIHCRRKDVVQYMIKNGADPFQTDYTGFSIISYATVSNNLELTKYLHETYQLPLGEQNDTQETSLHQCSSLGHIDVVKYCITRDPSLLHIQDERGDTPLHVAVLYDQMTVAQLLINSGSRVNLANYLNEHPLHIALMENCSEIIPSLLKAGADPNSILNIRDTATPLTLAIMCGGDSTLEYVTQLLKRGANPRLLHDKALILALRENIYHKDQIIKVLLEYNGNPNARWMGNPVLLDVCAAPNSSHLVSLLLEKGADVNAINRQGQTALMVACAKDYKDNIEILLKHGADPNKASWYGLTATMIANDSNHPSSHEVAQLLSCYTKQAE